MLATLQRGAIPYIPFKSNSMPHSNTYGPKSELWTRMFHFYALHRAEFLQHYHKRSNSESTFSMIKAKFNERIRCQTKTGQINEVLCKVLCHNLCCVIQIDPAERVQRAARQDQDRGSDARAVEELREDRDSDPAEGASNCDGKPLRCLRPDELRDDRDGDARPDDRQHDGAARSAEDDQPDGGIAAGDQSEDAEVVEFAEQAPRVRRPGKPVIESAEPEHRRDRAAEDCCGDLRSTASGQHADGDAGRNGERERPCVQEPPKGR